MVSEGLAAGWILAIDFGTTNTTAAMAVPGGTGPEVLEIENSRYLPSVVYRDEAGQLMTGRAAVRQAAVFPERAERVPKRALVAGGQVLLGDHPVAAVDLVGAVLGRVYTEAVRFQGGQPPALTVLTHPARWGSAQLGPLGAAAARAGIADPRLLAEPVAAAWFYARPSAGRVVAVFDLGGGTLDTAVLRSGENGYEIAGPPGGDANLGGEDFDELLLGQVSDLARDRDPVQWEELFTGTTPRDRRDRALLRSDVTSAKETLSDHNTTDLAVVGYAEAFHLTRPEFEALIDPAITRGVEELRQTITASGFTPAGLAGIYLTGGSSRIPAISARIAGTLGVLPDLRDDPKAVVALGALTAAANKVPPSVTTVLSAGGVGPSGGGPGGGGAGPSGAGPSGAGRSGGGPGGGGAGTNGGGAGKNGGGAGTNGGGAGKDTGSKDSTPPMSRARLYAGLGIAAGLAVIILVVVLLTIRHPTPSVTPGPSPSFTSGSSSGGASSGGASSGGASSGGASSGGASSGGSGSSSP